MQNKVFFSSVLSALLVSCFCASARELDRPEQWTDHSAADSWLHNYDPTLISRRLLSELSYQDLDDDQSKLRLETSLRFPIPINDHLTFGWQLMVPLAWKDTGTKDETGLGNLEHRIGLAGRISSTLRCGVGMNFEFPSASDDELGGTNMVYRQISAVRWDVMKGVNIGCNAEYSFTSGNESAGKVRALELKFPLAVKLAGNWSAGVTYKPRWDYEEDDERHRIGTSATRNWGEDHQYSWSLGAEFPLKSESLNWKVISGFTWFL